MKRYTMPIEELRLKINYDPETGIFRRPSTGQKVGFLTEKGYARIPINGVSYPGNRLAWAITHGEWPVTHVDHINHIRGDDRLCNLRLATDAQNNHNKVIDARNVSGFRGVYFREKYGKFAALIGVDRRKHWLGMYSDPVMAAMAYDRAAIYFFGEFAATNYQAGRL